MKTTLCLFALLLSIPAWMEVAQAQETKRPPTMQEIYEAGRLAYFHDDYVTAKRLLTQVNKADPKHRPTIIMLKHISMAEQVAAAKAASLEARMKRMTLPRLELEESSVIEVLDFLRLKVGELYSEGQKPNFIIKLDAEKERKKVTLKLAQVTLYDALNALASAAGLETVYDQYAVTIQPKGEAAAPAGTAAR